MYILEYVGKMKLRKMFRGKSNMEKYFISVLIPVYNEGVEINKNIHIVHDILNQNGINHEFVLVDDGSRDDTWSHILRTASELPEVRAARLSRNFGKEAALCAGIDLVRGDACIIMDSDLQHPPVLIPEMVRLWREEGFEVVEGVKSSRGEERLVNKLGAGLFYGMMKKLSGFDLQGASDFKLLDARVVAACRRLGERNTFFRGIASWVGFKRKEIPFEVAERSHGGSKWSLFKLFKLSITAITSFTSVPLQMVTFMGFIFLLGSLLLGLQTLYKYFSGIAVSGFTTVILLLLIIGSTLMISLGIIGTYVAKIFDEVKGRPRYIIADTIGKERNKTDEEAV